MQVNAAHVPRHRFTDSHGPLHTCNGASSQGERKNVQQCACNLQHHDMTVQQAAMALKPRVPNALTAIVADKLLSAGSVKPAAMSSMAAP